MKSRTNLTRRDDLWQPVDDQTLDLSSAAHLYRRAALGCDWPTLESATKRTVGEVADDLLRGAQPVADSPQLEQNFSQMKTVVMAGSGPNPMPAWWLYRLIHTQQPTVEKLVVFWHGHFSTSASKILSSGLMLRQNETLRRGALGKFEHLVLEISRDPAMLLYLDNATNRRNRPNENYARELLELFCLGLGNYSEQDIRELARAFTGWELRGESFQFNRFQHDPSEKSLFGSGGIYSGEQAVAAVVAHPEASRFIARKLFRYYVSDDLPIDPALAEPLAECLRENNFEMRVGLRKLFTSRLFFSDVARAKKIRSPVELAIGLLRSLNGTTNTIGLADSMRELGQALFYPPNVKGWDGGRQWINSATLVGRINLVVKLLDKNVEFASGPESSLDRFHNISTTEDAIDRAQSLMLAVELDQDKRSGLVKLLGKSSGNRSKLIQAIKAMSTMAEFQLS
jgi:uncharacterized protein (DUF1800 family)